MNDTIVAIATSLGNGAISIIKISGDNAIDLVSKVFVGKDLNHVKSHTIHYGHIVDNKEVLDEVLVSVFRAPNSFTKEDVVEINCHGGIFVTNKILELLLVKGGRLAEPGEFTKRAFLNGRIDLTQAEAVMDIIESQTQDSLKMANYGLLGETKKMIKDFREKLLSCIAQIEVNIDYPEYELDMEITNENIKPIIIDMLSQIDTILAHSEASKIIKQGLKTAIIGRPNVGKSSLLNALLREDKAIVTNIAGTTRDIVEGSINIGGVILDLLDTAGVRYTKDIVEEMGVKKTIKILDDADLIILVFDNSEELNEIDKYLLEITKDKNRIIVINKRDLKQKISLDSFSDYLLMSTFTQEDISKLEAKIKSQFNLTNIKSIDPTYIGNSRQIAKLRLAKQSLLDAMGSIDMGQPIDIINIDIRNAWMSLGEILGEVSNEDLINELFSKFCLGK